MLRHALSSLFRRLRADQRGMAVPTAVLATVAGLGIVTAAALSTVHSQRGTAGDEDRKAALAAADAGVNIALLRQNKVHASTSNNTYPCIGPGSGGTLVGMSASADGWCPVVTGTVGTATYSYRVSPTSAVTQEAQIVSTGASADVSRRVAVLTRLQTGSTVFGIERAIGRDWVILDSNADVRAPLGSNGDITMLSNSNVCGDIRYGIGKTLSMSSNASQCVGYSVTQGNRDIPQLSTAKLAQVRTTNSNGRFFAQDIRTSSSDVTWDASKRELFIGGSSTLTMGGTDYLLCKLTIDSNAGLIMAAGSNVRIYFDTPEACGYSSGALQVELKSNSYITSTAYDPNAGLFNVPGLYLFGSTTRSTRAFFGNNTNEAVNEFVLYAPNTDVEIDSNAIYTGALAGKTLHMKSNAVIVSHQNMVIPGLDIPPRYTVERYVECQGATAVPPNANC